MEQNKSASDLQGSIYDAAGCREISEIKDLRIKEIVRRITQGKRCRILDVGCGDGSLIAIFCLAHDCYGIDVSEAQLKKAHEKNIKTYRLDMENEGMPFENNYFDLVICSETIEHLLDPDNLLREIHRVLKSEGNFILTFPNMNQPISWLIQIMFDLPPVYSARYKSPHVRDYTLRIVKTMLSNFGFRTESITGTHIYPSKNAFSQWLAKIFPRLSEKIVLLSTKHGNVRPIQSDKVVWNVLDLIGESRAP
jgi:methionine biosynthesis protein MetW